MDNELRQLFRDISEMEARVHALRDQFNGSAAAPDGRKWAALNGAMSNLACVSGLIYDILPPYAERQCTCHAVPTGGGHWSFCPALRAEGTNRCDCVGLQHRENCPEHVVPL